MSGREMNNLDPKNIIDPSAPVATTRGGNASRISSTMVSAPPKKAVGNPPDISPIKEGDPDDHALDAAQEENHPQGEFMETPYGTGRLAKWRETPLPHGPVRSALSSTETEGEMDLDEALIDLRQDVDRYANDHEKDLDWMKTIDSEARRVMKAIEAIRAAGVVGSDYDLIRETDFLQARVLSAQEALTRKVPTLPETAQSGEQVQEEAPPPPPPASAGNVASDPDHPVDPAQGQSSAAGSIGNQDNRQVVITQNQLTPEDQVNLSLNAENNSWVATNQIIIELPSIADELNKSDSPQVAHQEFDRKLKLSFEQLVATVGIHTNKFVALDQKVKQVEGALKIVQDNGVELENQVNAFNPKIKRLEEGIKQFAVAVEDKFDEHIESFTQVSDGVDAIINDLKVTQTQVSAQKESVEKVASDVKYIGIVLKSTTERTTQLEKGQKKVVRKLTEMVQGPNQIAPPPSVDRPREGTTSPPPSPPPDSRNYEGNRLRLLPVRQPGISLIAEQPPRRVVSSPPGFNEPDYYSRSRFFTEPPQPQVHRRPPTPTPRQSAPTPPSGPPPAQGGNMADPSPAVVQEVGTYENRIFENTQRSVQCNPTLPIHEACPDLGSQPGNNGQLPQGQAIPRRVLVDIESNERIIHRIIDKEIPHDLCALKAIRADHLVTVRETSKELSRQIENLDKKYPGMAPKVIDDAAQSIRSAKLWMIDVQDKYMQEDGHSLSTDKCDIEVKMFKKNGDQTIFAFFDDFEAYFKGSTPVERARALYKRFLDPHFKGELQQFENNYPAMKDWLLARLGTKHASIAAIMKKLDGKTSTDNNRLDRLCLLSTVLRELVLVANRPESQINEDDYYVSYTDKAFIERFCTHFTHTELDEFNYRLMNKGIDPEFMYGRVVFDELIDYVKCRYKLYSAADAQISSHPHSAHCNTNQQPPSSPPRPQRKAANQVQSPRRSPPRVLATTRNAAKDWYDLKLKKPCPLDNHSHEIGTCAEFFSLSAKERRESAKNKLCWTCFDPLFKCRNASKSDKCALESSCSKLICTECAESNRAKHFGRYSGMNILLCYNQNHSKPSKDQLMQIFPDFFPGFTAEFKDTLVMSCSRQVFKARIPTGKASKSSPPTSEPENCFDSSTGEVKVLDLSLKIPESEDQPVYLIQLMKIGSTVFLVFYDTGSEIHLVNGDFAEKVKLQVITQSPTMFKGVADTKVYTDFGKYRLNIGPTVDGKFHELVAHGVSPVTGEFPKFDLSQINVEIRNSHKLPSTTKLPEFVGGSEVQLLIGIKNTAAQPKLLHQLGNGLAIYESPFADIFGSRICYGGTHENLSKQVAGINLSSSNFLSTLQATAKQAIKKVALIQEPAKVKFPQQEPVGVCPPVNHDDQQVNIPCSHPCDQSDLDPPPKGDLELNCKTMISIQRLRELADKFPDLNSKEFFEKVISCYE